MKLWRREPGYSREAIAVAVGAGVALAAGVLVWQWYRGRGATDRELEGALAGLEEDVVDLLRGDGRISTQPIEVAALAEGIVELSGAVETQADSDRAMAVAQRAPGVRTVLNRLDVLEESERAADARRRPDGPGTPKADTHWTGMGVGMGYRRQSRQTDPGRRDDRADMAQDALGIDRAVGQTSEILDKTPNASSLPQDADNAAPAHENVPPGTELDLERAGLEGELDRRHPTDHG